MLRRWSTLVAILTLGCRASPATPSPGQTITISGVVVSTQTGTPVRGAFLNVTLASRVEHVETDSAGRFTLSVHAQGTPAGTAVGVADSRVSSGFSPRYVTRFVNLGLAAGRDDVRLDIILDEPPFSLDFYRQFARDGRDTPPGNRPLRPWTVAPSFFLRTTHVETGAPIPPVILAELEAMIRNSVPELTGGRLQAGAIDAGPETPPVREGWVTVLLQSVLPNPSAGGQATVGGNSGTIWIQFDPANPRLSPASGTACSWATGAAEHEVVHTMGFYHVDAPPGVDKPLQSPDFCSGGDRPEIVRHHAAIVYARPVGNRHVDVDPDNILFATAPAPPQTIASCSFDRFN